MPAPSDVSLARVFVGTDRSQFLAVKVLEHSIRRHTDLPIQVRSMHDLVMPEPQDVRQSGRTGFSFARFAIPALCGYMGRAVYLDADMLVFRDFRDLFDLPFGGAKVLIQEELPEAAQKHKPGAPPIRVKQCSVMLLDCAALDWRAEDIIAGLDGRYTYEALMQQLCILSEAEIGYRVPFEWNSLEVYEPGRTGLLHYTDMNTQPWVYPDNANGWLWVNEVRMMLAEGAMALDEVRREVELGYFRPSLVAELQWPIQEGPPSAEQVAGLHRIDADAKFQAHKEAREQGLRRKQVIAAFEERLKSAEAPAPAEPGAPGSAGLLATVRRRVLGWSRKAS